MMKIQIWMKALALLCAGFALCAHAQTTSTRSGQAYPTRPVRIIVPLAAGGGMDSVTRVLALHLTDAFGQTVVVDNRPGAGSHVALEILSDAAPDGHTLMMLSATTVVYPMLYKSRFEIVRDFAPVSQVTAQGYVLVVHPSLPAKTALEFVKYAKANPGKLNYASAGKASPGHLTAEYFRLKTGTEMTHVPFRGNAEAIRSVLAGDTQIMFTPTTGALPHVRSGKLKALAVYLTDRVDEIPAVRSLESQGVGGFDSRNLPFWYGMLVPAATPREIVSRLNADTDKSLRDPQVASTLAASRIFVLTTTPEEFGAMLREGHAAWGKVIRETGVKSE